MQSIKWRTIDEGAVRVGLRIDYNSIIACGVRSTTCLLYVWCVEAGRWPFIA